MVYTKFALLFWTLVLLGLLTRTWLAVRQDRHVALHRDTVPPRFAHKVSQQAHAKAADYTRARLRLGFWEDLLGCVTLLGWTSLGGLAWLDAQVQLWLGQGMHAQLALVVWFVLIGSVIEMPPGLYATFGLEAKFGFNKTTWRTWGSDWLKSAGLGLLIGLPLLWAVFFFMQALGAWWWLWAWAIVALFSVVMLWLGPMLIMPLFNKFTPLHDEVLRMRVHRLMERCGFEASGFFVMDASRRSAHSNAFFVGLGRSRRVVFYDALLGQINHDEMEAILAHELGHAHYGHIPRRLGLQLLMSFAGFALMGWAFTKEWFYAGLGVPSAVPGAPHSSAVALVLFVLVAPVFMFFATPLFSHFSRRNEFAADAYACTHSSGKHLASALLKLYENNATTLTPDPLYMRFYASHPPAVHRLERLET